MDLHMPSLLKPILIQLSIVDTNFFPQALLLGTETCEAWEQTLPMKTETKTALVSAFTLIIRLPASFIKGQCFPRSPFCCQCTLTSLFGFFFAVHIPFSFSSSSALVFLIPSLHAQAMLQYSLLIACPCSHLVYTFFLHLCCQKEVMGLWMGRVICEIMNGQMIIQVTKLYWCKIWLIWEHLPQIKLTGLYVIAYHEITLSFTWKFTIASMTWHKILKSIR